jgi:hypothetical protein
MRSDYAFNLLGVNSPPLAAHDQEEKPEGQPNTPLLCSGRSFIQIANCHYQRHIRDLQAES